MSAGLPGAILAGRTDMSAGFIQNGNSFGANAILGTNDVFSLSFETSGSTRFTIDAASAILTGPAGGSVFVGGTAAGDDLTFRATANATDGDIIFQSDPTTERARILSTGPFLIGESTQTAGEFVGIRRDTNTSTSLRIINEGGGASASSSITMTADAAGARAGTILVLPAAFVTVGQLQASRWAFQAAGGTTLALGTESADPVILYTNSLERARFVATTGYFQWGTAPSGLAVPSEISIRNDQNATTSLVIQNNTAGTAAVAWARFYADAASALIGTTSSSYTPGLGINADEFVVWADNNCASLNLATRDATTPILFTLGGTERARFTPANGGQLLIGQTSAFYAGDDISVLSSDNDSTGISAKNSSAGAAAFCSLVARNNSDDNVFISAIGSGVSRSRQVELVFSPGATAGIIRMSNAFPLQFWLGGSVKASFLATTGEFLWGATSLIGSEIVQFRKDQNSPTDLRMFNAMADVAAQVRFIMDADAGQVIFGVTSSSFTASGPILQDAVYLLASASASGGLTLGTRTTTPTIIVTNDIERVRVNDTGMTHSFRHREIQGVDVSSANDLTLGTDGNTFEITGTTQINAITIVNWQNGSHVTLIFTSTPTVKHNTAGGAGTAVILLAGAVDFSATAGDVLCLVLSEQGGTQAWRETSRTVI